MERYKIIAVTGDAQEMQDAFNQLVSEGYVFKSFAQNFGTKPGGVLWKSGNPEQTQALALFEHKAGTPEAAMEAVLAIMQGVYHRMIPPQFVEAPDA